MPQSADRAADEVLDYAERWLRDGLAVVRPSFSVIQTTVDMTNANQRLDNLRKQGIHATATHLLVSAAARALSANRQFHQMIAGNRRHRPEHVDIGLSISGDTFVAPVLVVERADQKSVADIVEETTRRVPEIRAADQRMMGVLRRWGRLVPFGFLRRGLLRLLFTSATFRRKGAGTFQVSTVPADWALSSAFSTAGVLIGGQTRLRVVAVGTSAEVRSTMTLTLCGDHGVWDGRAAGRILSAVKTELESRLDHEEYAGEKKAAPDSTGAALRAVGD